MDYLIKMEMARANITRAIAELKEVDGMEYMVEQLLEMRSELGEEISEYKQHSDLE
jgi:chorismate mutase